MFGFVKFLELDNELEIRYKSLMINVLLTFKNSFVCAKIPKNLFMAAYVFMALNFHQRY